MHLRLQFVLGLINYVTVFRYYDTMSYWISANKVAATLKLVEESVYQLEILDLLQVIKLKKKHASHFFIAKRFCSKNFNYILIY